MNRRFPSHFAHSNNSINTYSSISSHLLVPPPQISKFLKTNFSVLKILSDEDYRQCNICIRLVNIYPWRLKN